MNYNNDKKSLQIEYRQLIDSAKKILITMLKKMNIGHSLHRRNVIINYLSRALKFI